ncbi:Linear gramicidin synthase subunit B [Candidatus Entotheonellaceae bacterium PAL068K]
MNWVESLKDLWLAGVELWADGERLRYRAPKDVLTPSVLTHLKQHKADILQLLRDAPDTLKVYSLSHGQRALWFIDQLAPQNAAYNVAFTVRICSEVDVAAFGAAWQMLAERHPMLRSRFPKRGDEPVREVHAAQAIEVQVIGASAWTDAALKRQVEEVSRQPFDLEKGPVMRLYLFSRCAQEHVFLLAIHHMACDAWSLELMLNDLQVLYPAMASAAQVALPRLTHTYQDFVRWQAAMLASSPGEDLWAYWQQRLAGVLPVLDLPTDHPRPAVQTYIGAEHTFRLSDGRTQQLRELAQAEGATLYTVFLAAFQVLLSWYTGQEDILVGSPAAGRSQSEFASIVGYFVNAIVLRADVSDHPPFKVFLAQVRQTVLEAIDHQDYPFPLLVDRLQPHRDASRSPIFQVLLAWQKWDQANDLVKLCMSGDTGNTLSWGGLRLAPFVITQQLGQFELALEVEEHPAFVRGNLKYNPDLFDVATMQRLSNHFQTLLAEIVEHPEQRVSQLRLPRLTAAERHQILVEWNDTQTVYAGADHCLHQLFEAQVERTPDAVAVVCTHDPMHEVSPHAVAVSCMTYAALNQRANQLAHYLQSLGVDSEVLVGICVERSIDMVLGLLGILKAGGAYVPLDPAYPPERLAFMLADAQTPVLLTHQRLQGRLPEHGTRLVCLDTMWDVLSQERTDNPASRVTADNPAYVIYTSGSTGVPKGVLGLHRGTINRLHWMWERLPFAAGDVCGQKTSLSFVDSVWEVFGPLLQGIPIVMMSDATLQEPRRLVQILTQEQVTRLVLVPSLLRALLDTDLDIQSQLPRLTYWISSGETLSVDLFQQFRERLPQSTLWNLYGSSEVAADVTWYDTHQNPSLPCVPIGRPIANMHLYLMDARLQPVPIGVPGELYVGGVGLARGYLRRPELTAERFIPNPYSNEPGACLYRTRDRARYWQGGEIEFLGRADHQVKIRGFRIELGEIEAVLSEHAAVREQVVVVRQDRPGDKRLVAYLVVNDPRPTQPPPDHSALVTDFRTHLGRKLPDYMVPAAFVVLEALPLTPNGKIDRKALPIPDRSVPDDDVTPRTAVEASLAAIWTDILDLDRIGRHDNFFALGGDSIISIKMVIKAAKQGLHLTVQQVFQHPTLGELATVVEPSATVQAAAAPSTAPVLTPMQHWFFEPALPAPHHYNQSMLLEVPPDLNPMWLEHALQAALSDHDALRLRFERHSAAGWRPLDLAPRETPSLTIVDLSASEPTLQPAALVAMAAAQQGSLDLGAGPLVRTTLFQMGHDQPGRLLVVMHQLAVDGVSWRILVEDVHTAYQQLAQQQKIRLRPKTAAFNQWAERLIEYAQSEAIQAERDYWLTHTRRPDALPLPLDYPAQPDANTEDSAAMLSTVLDTDQTGRLLQEVPPVYNTRINDVLLTALLGAFAQWTGAHHLLLDLEGQGREALFEALDLSRVTGCFSTIFPVLLTWRPHYPTAPGQALKSVKEQLRRVPKGGIGYGLLRYLSRDESTRGQLRTLPQAEVAFHHVSPFDQMPPSDAVFRVMQAPRGPERSPQGHRRYVLEVGGQVVDGELHLHWTYSRNLHLAATIERLAEIVMRELTHLITHCQSPGAGGYTPSDFPYAPLDDQEFDKLSVLLGRIENEA